MVGVHVPVLHIEGQLQSCTDSISNRIRTIEMGSHSRKGSGHLEDSRTGLDVPV